VVDAGDLARYKLHPQISRAFLETKKQLPGIKPSLVLDTQGSAADVIDPEPRELEPHVSWRPERDK
jgi:hypothetical protein